MFQINADLSEKDAYLYCRIHYLNLDLDPHTSVTVAAMWFARVYLSFLLDCTGFSLHVNIVEVGGFFDALLEKQRGGQIFQWYRADCFCFGAFRIMDLFNKYVLKSRAISLSYPWQIFHEVLRIYLWSCHYWRSYHFAALWVDRTRL